MKNRLLKAVLSACMLFTMQVQAFTNIHASESTAIPDGSYTVPTALMNSANIANPSMAGDALGDKGTLEVKDGKWYLIAEFKTLDFGGAGTIFGNASNISYYVGDDMSQPAKAAEIVSYRDNAKVMQGGKILENQRAVEKVRIPVAQNSKGVYISMYVDFMGTSPNAYIAFNVKTSIQASLSAMINKAKAYQAKDYSTDSYAALQTAITNAQSAITQGSDAVAMAHHMDMLNKAIAGLASSQKLYTLSDGTYTVATTVLKADSDTVSMAASAVKSATVIAKNNVLTIQLDMGSVTVFGQTAYVDKVEYEDANGIFKEAAIVERDTSGHMSKVSFTLAKNTKLTNVKFYYGGSTRGSAARLSLGLDKPTAISTSKFTKDGTYKVNIALWNASKDEASMAASALEKEATIIVKDGKPMMYMETKKMTLGTITAYLQEMKVGDKGELAKVVYKDAQGNPTMFSFYLPNESEMIAVQVNPHVAIMGNTFIPARIKVDYASLKKVSDATNIPGNGGATEKLDKIEPADENKTVNNEKVESSTGHVSATQQGIKTAAKTTSKGTVQTGDNTNMGFIIASLITSMGIMILFYRKRICKLEK